MVGLSRLAGGGLLLMLALLPLALDGKAAPEELHKPPPGLPTAPAALRILGYSRPDNKQSRAARDRMVHPEPQVGGGGDSRPLHQKSNKRKPSGCFGPKIDGTGSVSGMGCGPPRKPPPALLTAPAALRILGYSRPDSKQSRAARDRMVHPKPQVGGGGESPPLQDETNKGNPSSCFGQKIDRINAVSGMGCGRPKRPPPALPTAPAALRILGYSRPDSKQSRAARDRMVHPEPQVGGGGESPPLQDETNKGNPSSCFGQKIDRINAVSGMGCGRPKRPPPALLTALAALRILGYSRPDSKQSRAARDRMVHPEPQVGGSGDSRPLHQKPNKRKPSGCFGPKIDGTGSVSGMGCGPPRKPLPGLLTAPAALRILGYLRPDSKQSRAARDRMLHPEPQVGGGGESPPLQDETNERNPSSCFGQKIDRIGSMSGMGCGSPRKSLPALPTAPAALRFLGYSRPDSKQSRAA